jgi:proteasome lid subunit RPN8/RPN11
VKYIDEIFKYAEECYPEEACGLLIEVDGREEWVPCENHADNPEEEFVFNSVQFIQTVIRSDKVIAIVHSHPDGTALPSEHDLKASNFLKIPYLIVSWPDKDLQLYEPK